MRRIISVLYLLTIQVLLHAQNECRQTDYILQSKLVSPPYNTVTAAANTLNIVARDIVIPVVVHIISNGSTDFVTNEQVYAQIDALNRDYNAANGDRLKTPSYFLGRVANCGIRFELAKVDPGGNLSTGIVRRKTAVQAFALDDKVKFNDRGGDDAWPRDHYLNIWVCPLISAISGYASVPGAREELDGVVINESVFGITNRNGINSLGRVAVHEIGHWLGLKHIWGDGYCGDDGIDDTPQQKSYHKGCPSGLVTSCGSDPGGDMYMNYMDLTDDACRYMFTEGQKKKMLGLFEPGQARFPLLSSGALSAPGNPIDALWGNKDLKQGSVANIGLSPVPATTSLRVELLETGTVPGSRLLVYNIVGQPLLSVPVTGKVVQIDISTLKSGQYLLKVENSGVPASKFIKL
ncbi:zinc-dependent metalloprotease [Flavihumibacter profundi]|uniref:zinc-dependent metalloprotease n=1 Tax=Flavihumibacter profundi TaxID=2716883 RepID=UPI001CC49B3E|nr:zinc-dependent metalloprotease [Flavihumibacter profundi]MBZ5855731.1 zinc-dependent metalloprotease [Flavihumibacter profundi]